MPDRTFDIVIDILTRAEGLEQARAQYEQLRGSMDATTASQARRAGLMADINKLEQTELATAMQRAAVESQQQVITQTRLELTAAVVRGEEAQAAILRDELAVRSATLGVMRNHVLTAAELNVLTEREAALLAVAAKGSESTATWSLMAGASLNKAKGEATVLAREIATGSV